MLDILGITAPIFLLIGIGFAAVRSGYFDKTGLSALGAFVIQLTLPVLMFRALSQRSLAEVLNARYLAVYAVGSVTTLILGLTWARYARKQRLDAAAVQAMGMASANSVFIGYPIALQLLGPIASLALALTLMVENLLMLPLCFALADCGGNREEHFFRAFVRALAGLRRNPIILAIVAGLVCASFSLQLPVSAAKALDMLAAASAATSLFFIGGSLVGIRLRAWLGDVSAVAVGKLLLHPLLVGAAAWLLMPAEPALAMAAVLIASAPMFSIYPILGQKYGLQGFCAASQLLTTTAAFFSTAAVIWILRQCM